MKWLKKMLILLLMSQVKNISEKEQVEMCLSLFKNALVVQRYKKLVAIVIRDESKKGIFLFEKLLEKGKINDDVYSYDIKKVILKKASIR